MIQEGGVALRLSSTKKKKLFFTSGLSVLSGGVRPSKHEEEEQ